MRILYDKSFNWSRYGRRKFRLKNKQMARFEKVLCQIRPAPLVRKQKIINSQPATVLSGNKILCSVARSLLRFPSLAGGRNGFQMPTCRFFQTELITCEEIANENCATIFTNLYLLFYTRGHLQLFKYFGFVENSIKITSPVCHYWKNNCFVRRIV